MRRCPLEDLVKVTRRVAGSSVLLLLCGLATAASGQPSLQVWPVDPLIKVFPDATPGPAGVAGAEVARGECATLQVVVRAERAINGLRAQVSELDRALAKGRLAPRAPRFVGYVPVDRPIQKPPADQLRKPPADFPDPLLEVESVDIPAGLAQAIWVTVLVPTNAPPGTYRGSLSLAGNLDGKSVRLRQRLEVKVWPAVVGPSRLWVTEWFAMHWPHMAIAPQPESDDYYALLARYARNLAAHRHNVALISPLGLVSLC